MSRRENNDIIRCRRRDALVRAANGASKVPGLPDEPLTESTNQ